MDTRPVYFIQAGDRGPIKIGIAANPEARLTALQIGHHERLRLLTTFPGGPAMERLIHARLAGDHLRGEWFRPSPLLEKLVVHARYENELADEFGWCQRCCVRPVAPPRTRYCSARCATTVAHLRSRDWRRARSGR